MDSPQQQQAPAGRSVPASTVLGIAALVAAAGAIFWLGWGDEFKKTPAPTQIATATPAPATPGPATPAAPAQPRPTLIGKVAGRKLQPRANGTLNFGGTYCFVIHYNTNWNGVDQQYGFVPEPGYPRQEGDTLQVKGNWSPNGASFDWDQTVQSVDPRTLNYEVSLSSASPVATNALALGINLPPDTYSGQQIIIDGQKVKLPIAPANQATAIIFPERVAQTIEFATPTGHIAIDGPVSVLVQDNRAYGGDVYYIRLGFTPGSGMITQARLKLKIRQVGDPPPLLDGAPSTRP